MIKESLIEIKEFFEENVLNDKKENFVIIYGGSIYKNKSNSDIDIACYIPEISLDEYHNIKDFIVSVHEKYRLKIDNEVPFDNKLIYTSNDLKNALNLECFINGYTKTIDITPVQKTFKFLSSRNIKSRLLINALTTPHIQFGNKTAYSDALNHAKIGMLIAAMGIIGKNEFSKSEILNALSSSSGGHTGELYLGYKTEHNEVTEHIGKWVNETLIDMEKLGIISHKKNSWVLGKPLKDIIDWHRDRVGHYFSPRDPKKFILNKSNALQARDLFASAVDIGINFKLQDRVRNKIMVDGVADKILKSAVPTKPKDIYNVLEEFKKDVLPYCYNFSSPMFMGFPDAGNSIAAITGSIISDFLQQNMINQSFCSPSGTFVESAVINWLRQVVGYEKATLEDAFSIGGIITGGGTTSNATAMLLARENFKNSTMESGVNINDDFYLIVPQGIGHYSVKSAQMWIGCGNRLLEVPTNKYRYDLKELEKTLKQYKGRIMGIVAYVGDSRTMTIDNLPEIVKLRNKIDPAIWLHADACHGFSLGLSKKLSHMIKGIEDFDSITTDPHKVMNIPYTISALLLKNPEKIKQVSSLSDLIMKERYAFGQVTPFIGSKPWSSLKLWFAFKNIGLEGYAEIIEKRRELALALESMIIKSEDFVTINDVNINSVAFMYIGNKKKKNIEKINNINKKIHARILEDGIVHLHQFSIPDDGVFKKDAIIYPLRFMSGNPNTTKKDLQKLLSYIRKIAGEVREDD